MPYDPRSVEVGMVNFLTSFNTTTASVPLFASLTTLSTGKLPRMAIIEDGTPRSRPLATTDFPAILVWANHDIEDWGQMGSGAQRDVMGELTIMGAVCGSPVQGGTLAGGQKQRGADASRQNMMTLLQNIKTNIRRDLTIAGTVAYARPVRTQYDAQVEGIGDLSKYCWAGLVTVEFHLITT